MQTASQAAASALSSGCKPQSTNVDEANQPSSKARLSQTILDDFWLRMAGLFGHTWVSQYGAAPGGVGGDVWAAALAGITPRQIATGLKGALALGGDYPPSAPRFRAMCLDIPLLATVRAEIADRDARRSPFARLVWSKIDDHHGYRTKDGDRADRMLRDAYELAREHVMRGGSVPEPAAELEAPAPAPRTPASPEMAKRHLSELSEKLRLVDDDAEQTDAPASEMRLETP